MRSHCLNLHIAPACIFGFTPWSLSCVRTSGVSGKQLNSNIIFITSNQELINQGQAHLELKIPHTRIPHYKQNLMWQNKFIPFTQRTKLKPNSYGLKDIKTTTVTTQVHPSMPNWMLMLTSLQGSSKQIMENICLQSYCYPHVQHCSLSEVYLSLVVSSDTIFNVPILNIATYGNSRTSLNVHGNAFRLLSDESIVMC